MYTDSTAYMTYEKAEELAEYLNSDEDDDFSYVAVNHRNGYGVVDIYDEYGEWVGTL